MKFNAIAILAALAATVSAAPANELSPRDRFINDCRESTFINQSSAGSPLVKDCEQIVKNISNGGSWLVNSGTSRQLLQYGTCAFGVATTSSVWVRIGEQDITDIINDSIKKFRWFDKVGAKGKMPCEGWIEWRYGELAWAIYHT